jgi:hypothetical protein
MPPAIDVDVVVAIPRDTLVGAVGTHHCSGARQGIVVGGELLADSEAHKLGLALVRAADVLRRARMEVRR